MPGAATAGLIVLIAAIIVVALMVHDLIVHVANAIPG